VNQAEEFWAKIQANPPSPRVLRAEKLDLTRTERQMIASVGVFDKIMKSLNPQGAEIFLAGMYLQGSLTSDARESYEALMRKIEERQIGLHREQLPDRRGKSSARLARGL
jgi:hypothetical protein